MNTIPENNPVVKAVSGETIPWHRKLLFSKRRAKKNYLDYSTERAEIIESLKNARNEWMNANINFDYVSDQEMIDFYTYQIKACEIRYEYYLKKAKKFGLSAEPLESNNNIPIGTNNTVER